MFSIDYQNRTPIYEQIINQIERYVALGILKPDEQIPSIRDMAAKLGINPNTVSKSYTILENKGIIKTISTKGTFITDKTSTVVNNKISDILISIEEKIEELEKFGLTKNEILKRLK